MFFNLKLVISSIALAGAIAPLYLSFQSNCSFTQTNYFYKSSIDISESVLDCKEGDKNYSIFLVSEDSEASPQKQNFSFQVVDNNDNKKIKWGPKSNLGDKWTEWGIQIAKNEVTGTSGGGQMKPKLGFQEEAMYIKLDHQYVFLVKKANWD